MKQNQPGRTNPVFLEDRLYRIKNRIYFRDQRDGTATWLSTGTSELPKARKWREKRDHDRWMVKNGFATATIKVKTQPRRDASKTFLPNSQATPNITLSSEVNVLLDQYEQASHPIVKKRAIKPKSPRTIRNEKYCLSPLRAYFGKKACGSITLADCDEYRDWRNSGGYVAEFTVRGHKVTRKTRGGDRAVDLELVVLGNAYRLSVRRGQLNANSIAGRGQYTDEDSVRHCRDVAPTPANLVLITTWLTENGYSSDAEFTEFLAYTGLRLGEALNIQWQAVDWDDEIIHVSRSKKGVFPFVLLLPELRRLLRKIKRTAESRLIFPSPLDPEKHRDDSCYRRRLAKACRKLKLPHVTPQGLRSYYVAQARQSGLTDAEIAQLIGDKTGPLLIAEVYGDVRPDHLLAVARKIRLTAQTRRLNHTSKNNKRRN